jgi:molecular chaperone DnaK
LLGQFDLVGLPAAPRGVPQIEVAFDIDANGIVNVSAKDKATGKEQQIRIQASGGLSDSEVETMVQDAESYAEDDKKRREEAEARNQADALIHATEKSIADLGDKVPAEEKSGIEAAVSELRTALEGDDIEAIKAKSETLMQASMKLGEMAYQAEQEADGEDPAEAEGGGDDVVDADFEEVDDDDKKSTSA